MRTAICEASTTQACCTHWTGGNRRVEARCQRRAYGRATTASPGGSSEGGGHPGRKRNCATGGDRRTATATHWSPGRRRGLRLRQQAASMARGRIVIATALYCVAKKPQGDLCESGYESDGGHCDDAMLQRTITGLWKLQCHRYGRDLLRRLQETDRRGLSQRWTMV